MSFFAYADTFNESDLTRDKVHFEIGMEVMFRDNTSVASSVKMLSQDRNTRPENGNPLKEESGIESDTLTYIQR